MIDLICISQDIKKIQKSKQITAAVCRLFFQQVT